MASTSLRRPMLFSAARYIGLFPLALCIIFMELIMMRAYREIGHSSFGVWVIGSVVGVLISGILADRYNRQHVLIGGQILGLVSIYWISVVGWNSWNIAALTVSFSPGPVARSAFVDALPDRSRVHVLAAAFACKFVPWIAFPLWVSLDRPTASFILVSAMALNVALTYLMFFEERRLKARKPLPSFRSSKRLRVLCLLLAIFLAESTFYLADMLMQISEDPSKVLPAFACSCLFGAVLHFLLRPSISSLHMLWYTFALGFAISVIATFSLLYTDPSINEMRLLALLLSALGGFYLPGAYDLLLGWSSPLRKGLSCSVLEVSQHAAELFVLVIIAKTVPTTLFMLFALPPLFLVSMIVQYAAEVRMMTSFLHSFRPFGQDFSEPERYNNETKSLSH